MTEIEIRIYTLLWRYTCCISGDITVWVRFINSISFHRTAPWLCWEARGSVGTFSSVRCWKIHKAVSIHFVLSWYLRQNKEFWIHIMFNIATEVVMIIIKILVDYLIISLVWIMGLRFASITALHRFYACNLNAASWQTNQYQESETCNWAEGECPLVENKRNNDARVRHQRRGDSGVFSISISLNQLPQCHDGLWLANNLTISKTIIHILLCLCVLFSEPVGDSQCYCHTKNM